MKTIPQLEDEIQELHKLYDKLAVMYDDQKENLCDLRRQIGVPESPKANTEDAPYYANRPRA